MVQIVNRAVSYWSQVILEIICLCVEPCRATMPTPRNRRRSRPIGSAPAVGGRSDSPIASELRHGARIHPGDVLTETATFSASGPVAVYLRCLFWIG
jgi:hypothetical protein